jgi:hypothetical protein
MSNKFNINKKKAKGRKLMFMSHSPIRKKIKEIVTYYDRNFDLTV